MHKHHPLHKDESGLASLVITIVMIFVLTLIVVTFARISQREQRQALDRQLNTQAFYAAETGINDALEELKNPNSQFRTGEKTDCAKLPNYNNVIDVDGVISYSCLLIDPDPPRLIYDGIEKGKSKIIPIERDTGSVNRLSIYWHDGNGDPDSDFSDCPSEVQNSFPISWSRGCNPGMLRIDLVPVPTTGSFSRNDLINNTMTVFAMPQDRGPFGGTIDYLDAKGFGGGQGGQGAVVGVGCRPVDPVTNPRNCLLQITNLTSNRYYMRVMPLYNPAALTICSPDCDNPGELIGAQATIDATGRANDILRRIQVRAAIDNAVIDDSFPNYALESSGTICKRFAIAPPGYVQGDGADPACVAP